MRPHGSARADRHKPSVWGLCDNCGFLFNKSDLRWQMEWAGNRLVNQNMLVCDRCYDAPQEQNRTIILPPDPSPVVNPRPEATMLDNPVSGIASPIGTMTAAAGLAAAFDSNTNKPMFLSAVTYLSTTSNTVGVDWTGLTTNNAGITANAFTVYAPNDAKLFGGGSTAYTFQGSNNKILWVTLASGNTIGTVGEIITSNITPTTSYLYHQFALTGNSINSVSVAQLQISCAGLG